MYCGASDMWRIGQRVRDRTTGKEGEIIRITLPSPLIYRLRLDDDDVPLVVYRYDHQLDVPSSRGGTAPQDRCG